VGPVLANDAVGDGQTEADTFLAVGFPSLEGLEDIGQSFGGHAGSLITDGDDSGTGLDLDAGVEAGVFDGVAR